MTQSDSPALGLGCAALSMNKHSHIHTCTALCIRRTTLPPFAMRKTHFAETCCLSVEGAVAGRRGLRFLGSTSFPLDVPATAWPNVTLHAHSLVYKTLVGSRPPNPRSSARHKIYDLNHGHCPLVP